MIVTRTWLQEFIDISNISTDDICKTLNSIGLEVDSVKKNHCSLTCCYWKSFRKKQAS